MPAEQHDLLPVATKLVKDLCAKPGVHIVDREATAHWIARAMQSAGLRCAELNAAERVRDAAPQLLAACEAALQMFQETGTGIPSVVKQIAAAIKAAKGTA